MQFMLLGVGLKKGMWDRDLEYRPSGCGIPIEVDDELSTLVATWRQWTSMQRKALTTNALAMLPPVF